MNKREAQIKHARKRFLQRHNKELTLEDYKSLLKLIMSNQTTCIKKISNRVSLHEIAYNKELLYVIYDKERHAIVTFLQYKDEKIAKIKNADDKRDMCRIKNIKIQNDFEKFNEQFLQEMEKKEFECTQ